MDKNPLIKNWQELYEEYDLPPLPEEVIDRSGLPVNIQGDKWKINDATFPSTINFDKADIFNQFIIYAIKRYLIQRIKSVSPRETVNCWYSLKSLTTTNKWNELQSANSIEDTEKILPVVLSEILEDLRRRKSEDQFHRIRAWYVWCAEQELPGFSAEVMYDLLKIKLPGNEKGKAVMLDDEEQGPLTDTETTALRNALINDKGPILERVCVWLCLAFGCNPANFALLREDDFIVRDFKNSNHKFYELKIPRIKERGLKHQRSEFKSRKVDDKLAVLLLELIAHNKLYSLKNNLPTPLLMRETPNKSKLGTPIEEFAYHLSSKEFTENILKCITRLNIISPRTGRLLAITPRRLRYTFATAMVRQGASAAELADLLDHTDLQHVQVYYNARSTIVERLDTALAEKLAPLVAQFSVKVIDKNTYNESNLNSRIKYQEKTNPKKIHGIGVCCADFLCKLYPPLSCYLCEKFQPFKDAPHAKILEELTSWRQNRLQQQRENDRIAQQLDDVIYRIAQVKTACEEKSGVINEK